MKKAAVVKTVRNGALRIEIREFADGRFGFDWQQDAYDRKKVRLHDLSDAEARARELLGATKAGTVDLLKIDPDEYAEFLRWKAEHKRTAPVADVVKAFLDSKRSKGRSNKHLRGLEYSLNTFAEAFPVGIEMLTRHGVESWLDKRGVGPRRWNNVLADIVALIRFARRDGMIGNELTPVEMIERQTISVVVRTYTPAEMEAMIASVDEEWLPTIVLQGFCGLRPEEVCPEKDTGKDGIRWEHILWHKNKIDIPASISKTRKRRFASLTLPAIEFLRSRQGDRGQIAGARRFWHYLADWKKATGLEWKPDALRHSFASYRLALTKDVPALSLDMGNSPSMIFRHYLDLKHEDEAEQWFGIRPKVP